MKIYTEDNLRGLIAFAPTHDETQEALLHNIATSLNVIAVCYMAANAQFAEPEPKPAEPPNKTKERSFIGQKAVD